MRLNRKRAPGPGTELIPSPCILCLSGIALFIISSCAAPDASYFPTAPGYEWTYDISRTVPEIRSSLTQKSIVRNLPARTVDGITYYPKIYANGKKHYFSDSPAGISRRHSDAERADLVIGYPLSAETEWRAASALFLFDLPKKLHDFRGRISRNLVLDYTITSTEDEVDVPAGRFIRCLRVDAVGFLDLPQRLMLGIRLIKVEQTQWYAPGVGLVKMTRKEYAIPNLYPSEYTQVLTSFKPG